MNAIRVPIFEPVPIERVKPPYRATSREREILALVAQGYSNKMIGESLGLSEHTVKNHMTTCIREIGGRDRTGAAMVALQQGWIRIAEA